MSMNAGRSPRVPTLPHGEQVAAYATYLEAQRAVDHLSDKEFPVEHVTIVGTDLRMVERITGRLTYSRVALAGLASGAWFGLAMGVLLSLFSGDGALQAILFGVSVGAAFGILFAVISYAFARGQRDFTSASQIVATSYALLCAAEQAGRARQVLQADGGPGLGRAQVAGFPGAAAAAGGVVGGAAPGVPGQAGAPGQVPGAGSPPAAPPTQPPPGSTS